MKRATLLAAPMLVALVGGLASLVLAQGPAGAAFPGDNGRIAFSALRDGNVDVFSVRAGGTGLKRLTGNRWVDEDPSFSADGEKIAFVSRRGEGNDAAIWAMNADGTRERQLTFPAGPFPRNDSDHYPVWSPDGKRMAYLHVPPLDTDYSGHVYALNLSTGRERDLTRGFWVATSPSWSPDGRRIAFVGDKDGQGEREIYTMRADGTGIKRITDNAADEWGPDWSPDGSKIVFRTDRTGEDYHCTSDGCDRLDEIYVMGRDGSDQTRLTHASPDDGPDGSPAWSPDGSEIVFERGGELWTMRADGTAERDLTGIEGDAGYYPSWQPLPEG